MTALADADNDPKAFADDLGLPATELNALCDALPIIDRFTFFSGLGVNREKTCILSAHKIRKIDRETLATCPESWRNIRFVSSAVYLGILMGRSITNLDIYDKAFRKFVKRSTAIKPLISHLSTQHKVITANVFLTPIFSYLIQFFLVPSSILSAV